MSVPNLPFTHKVPIIGEHGRHRLGSRVATHGHAALAASRVLGGRLAQMVRASALHAEGQRFESSIAQFPAYWAPSTGIAKGAVPQRGSGVIF